MKRVIRLTVNGQHCELAVEPFWTLAEVLREHLRLTGVKVGCGVGDCGACTALVDGKPVLTCILPAVTVDGAAVDTVEGLARDGELQDLQRAFLDHGAVQCGFCTPGMLTSAAALLRAEPRPDEQAIREHLSGNLCRCTGYTKIIEAVACAANARHEHCGHRAAKVDGVPQVTGAATFTDDMLPPNMLYGKILRSPHSHARILSINTAAAERIPGVLAVMTGRELPVRYGVLPTSQDETALCIDKVRFIGDGVAAVAAVDERTAELALGKIKVDYEVLPAILTVAEALREDLPKIHADSRHANNTAKRVELQFGDVDEGFAEADYVREDEFTYGPSTHAMLEPHAAVAVFEPARDPGDYRSGHLTVWSATQTPHYVHRTLAKVLDMPAAHIRVVKPYLGGGFGGKSEPFALEFCAAWLAIKSGRPVKITYSREEVFYSHRGRHRTEMRLKTGVMRDGSITAIDYHAWLDGGAYGSFGVITAYYTGQLLTLPYRVPRFRFASTRVYTNKPPAGPKRGHGAVQPRFAFECHLDRIAEAVGLDPAEIRLRNLVRANSMTVNALRITSCGAEECIRQVMERAVWPVKRGKLPRGRGIGIAASAYISGAGKEINWLGLPHSGAIVKLDRGGGVTVFCGSSDIGQGSNTALATLAAGTLGISVNDVRVYEADTDLTPVDLGSYSSRVTFMAGNAVLRACDDLRRKLLDAAAESLQTDAVNLELRGGGIQIINEPERRLSFIEAVRLAEAKYGTLAAAGWYAPPPLGGTYKGSGAGPSPAYSFTAHVAELSVDEDTGKVTLHHVWTAHDCGKALNRAMVEGQIEGSVYMGIGEALPETLTLARRTGLLQQTSLLNYRPPTTLDMPFITSIIVESNDPEGPAGAKEAGEGPLLGVASAIGNAIYDAIGIRLTETPFTPERILAALAQQRQRSSAGAAKLAEVNGQ